MTFLLYPASLIILQTKKILILDSYSLINRIRTSSKKRHGWLSKQLMTKPFLSRLNFLGLFPPVKRATDLNSSHVEIQLSRVYLDLQYMIDKTFLDSPR
jgi:hypothetical protein